MKRIRRDPRIIRSAHLLGVIPGTSQLAWRGTSRAHCLLLPLPIPSVGQELILVMGQELIPAMSGKM